MYRVSSINILVPTDNAELGLLYKIAYHIEL